MTTGRVDAYSALDKMLIANLAAFYYIDKNMQYHAEDLINFDGGVDNLPKVNIYGFEGEFTALLPAQFRLERRGKFRRLCRVRGSLPRTADRVSLLTALRAKEYRDIYGNAPSNLPPYSANVALSQTTKFADGSSLLSRYDVIYRDAYADTVFGNSFYYTTPSYVMMNLLFDYTFANREEVSYRFTNQYGGETTQNWFPPREYRIGIGYKF